MPFITAIIGAIGAAVAAVGTFIAGLGALGQLALSFGLNLAIAAIQSALAPKPKKPPSGVDLELQLGEDVPRKVRCGRFGVAGHLNYANTYGSGNKYLQQPFVISDFPVTSLDNVWIDGEFAVFADQGNPSGLTLTNTEHAGLIYVKFVNGHQTTADAQLVAYANPSSRWGANHIGIGTAYVIVTMVYDREKLAHPPSFFFEGKGAPLYDWRKDSTVGGAGSHRWDDQSTWEYSENPMLAAYAYYRGFDIGGDIFCGMEMQASDLPLSPWTMAANICEESVPSTWTPGFTARPRYVTAIGLDCTLEHGDNIDALMKSCGGMIVDGVDGTWPIIGTNQPTVATLTDADLIVGAPVRFQARRAMNELVNSVSGTFPNPQNQWSPAGYERATDAATVAVDRRTRDVAMNFDTVPNGEQAAQLASIYFSENRREATAQIMVRPRWQVLEPGDWIVWESARYGTKTYMVTNLEIASLDSEGPRNTVLSLQERSGDIYNSVGVTTPTLPLGPALPAYQTEMQDFAVVAVSGVGDDGRVYPAIRVSWTAPADPTVAGVVVQYRVKAQPTVTFDKSASFDKAFLMLAEGVVSLTVYEVRHRLTTDPTRETTWTAWVEVTTLDTPATDVLVGLGQVKEDIEGRFETLQAEMDDVRTTLTDIGTSLQLGSLANWQTISKVGERTGQAEAQIALEQLVRTAEDEALAAELATLMASVGDNSARITVERVARVDGDDALAAEITTLSSEVDGNAAAIITEQQARASGDSANAAAVTAVSADLNGRFASGLMKFEAAADQSGVDARFAILLRAGTGDAFKESGLFLELYTEASVQKSRVSVLADQFVVTDGTTTTLPLVFENGELKLQGVKVDWADILNANIEWANIDNVSIVSADIQTLTIKTLNLEYSAITGFGTLSGSTNTSPGSGMRVLDTLVVNNENPNPVFINYSIQAIQSNFGSTTTRIRRTNDNVVFKQVIASVDSGDPPANVAKSEFFIHGTSLIQGNNTFVLESDGSGQFSIGSGSATFMWWKR